MKSNLVSSLVERGSGRRLKKVLQGIMESGIETGPVFASNSVKPIRSCMQSNTPAQDGTTYDGVGTGTSFSAVSLSACDRSWGRSSSRGVLG